MGATRLYEYKCDQCGKVKTVPHNPADISYPPNDWYWVGMCQGYEDYISLSASCVVLLCEKCAAPYKKLILGEGE